jgi:hypothetical protein
MRFARGSRQLISVLLRLSKDADEQMPGDEILVTDFTSQSGVSFDLLSFQQKSSNATEDARSKKCRHAEFACVGRRGLDLGICGGFIRR